MRVGGIILGFIIGITLNVLLTQVLKLVKDRKNKPKTSVGNESKRNS